MKKIHRDLSLIARLLTTTGAGMALLFSGCGLRVDEKYVQPFTLEVSNWRQYLGVAVAIQLLVLAWVFWTTDRKAKMSRLFLSLLLLPLVWTVLGEWAYRMGNWVLSLGLFGRAIAIILSFAGGIHGTASVYSFLLGAVVFNDTRFLLYWVVPGVAASGPAAIAYLVKGKKRE
ncbi:MAG: hypothetical protein ACYC51_00970 [Thermoleophilia bacterium]